VHISNRLNQLFGDESYFIFVLEVEVQECWLMEEFHDQVGAVLLLVQAVGVILDDRLVVDLCQKLKVLLNF
jgi:hypothetical protein